MTVSGHTNKRASCHESRILIVGLGLIGGSLAAGLRAAGYDGHIVACDPNHDEVALGIELGLVDSGGTRLGELLKDVSMVVLAVPVLAMERVMTQLAESLSDAASDVVITDVGSTKATIRECAERVFGCVPPNMVLGHPIAGSEKSGVAAANPLLYENHKVILTPEANVNALALKRVEALWQACGAQVLHMSVERHDQVLARTSHLPHLLAAGGFRDFTRIAGSDPVMWRDIFIANREAVLSSLDDFEAGLKRLRQAVEEGDSDALIATFDIEQNQLSGGISYATTR